MNPADTFGKMGGPFTGGGTQEQRDAFHAHLDVCSECANNPMLTQCEEGLGLLRAAATGLEPPPANPFARRRTQFFDHMFGCDPTDPVTLSKLLETIIKLRRAGKAPSTGEKAEPAQ